MVYFSLAKASKITFQRDLFDTSLGAASSYTRINRDLTSTPKKKGNEEYAALSYQFVSSFFGISDKFEARSLKILLSIRVERAQKLREFPRRLRDVRKNVAGGLNRNVLTVRFEIPFVTHKSVTFARDITIIPTRSPAGETVTVVNGGTSRWISAIRSYTRLVGRYVRPWLPWRIATSRGRATRPNFPMS